MDLQLEGKRALVTGSSSGLGEAIAKQLASEGATVLVHGRDPKRTQAVAEAIGGSFVLGDLTTDSGADAVSRAAGDIDILINNAGAYHHDGWNDTTSARWGETFETNVVSGVRMIQRFVPGMRGRGWGRVITIGGGLAIQPIALQPDYSAALAARHNLAVSLARDLKDTGVTSNVVAPGAIHVAAIEEALMHVGAARGWGTTWEQVEAAAARELLPNDIGRLGRPAEIAAAVAFLASPHAAYISGAVIRVDGGTIRSV